jgi:cytochrome oxidase Cu insertion factor (SCO1/SenC/PrrC family)/thiol-disulfide isomerase/thioredoxin
MVLAVLLSASLAPTAHADGDPGSDVLVYQSVFLPADAGASVNQQLQLGQLLNAAAGSRFPIRVAIIPSRFDLGAVTALWHNPRAYARFLGLELSGGYSQRLLVVMPNGFGFNWPGHSSAAAYRLLSGIAIKPDGSGLVNDAQAAVRKLAAAAGVTLSSPAGPASGAGSARGASTSTAQGQPPARSADHLLGTIALALAAAAALLVLLRRALRSRRRPPARPGQPAWRWRSPASPRGPVKGRRARASAFGVLLALGLAAVLVAVANTGPSTQAQGAALASNPYLDPGTPLSGPAPDFTLSDQFGQPVSLHSYRGKVVVLAFSDSECTTECPLTTTAMAEAKAMLGKASSQVQLLGIDANPTAISLQDVWSYSQLHGLQHDWRFLTGSLPQLRRVWRQYAVEAAVEHGQITHTPALFVIDPQGRKAKVYVTQMSYTATGQLGQLLAQEISSLLPNHPRVRSELPFSRIPPTTPTHKATLPRAGGGTVALGPSGAPRLFLFFASWDQQTSGLAGQLEALNRYQHEAVQEGLPRLTGVDEASVEPGNGALTSLLGRLESPLSYPVAIDRTGKLADGYEVLGLPWFVLTSATGQILYYRDVSTTGWPSTATLTRYVRAALARAPRTTGVQQQLAGSPAPLAALHKQASQLLGGQPALAARIRALRGNPIVINAWASWCGPCRAEFGLLASASARYGRQVAFLGADSNDSAGDAKAFLTQHPVSYPSYQTTTSNLSSLAAIQGLPTTIFINRAGKVTFVHTGQYDAQGTLNQDVETYALGP